MLETGTRTVRGSNTFIAFATQMRGTPSIFIEKITDFSNNEITNVTTQVVWSNYLGFKIDLYNLDGDGNTMTLKLTWTAALSGRINSLPSRKKRKPAISPPPPPPHLTRERFFE